MEALKKLIFAILVFTYSWAAQGQANCISHKDLKEMAQHFKQFNRFLTNQSEYCVEDLGADWLSIGQSLVVLKNLQPDEPIVDSGDAFTFKAISETNWWAYFTKRAHEFELPTSCQDNVVAYVYPFYRGTIYLCRFFFDQSVTSQASVMMHEVRHFDGHRHVTCTQGNEQGNRGACDNEITGRGSYAISVQTLVGMARSKEIAKNEKAVVEAEAIYMAFNKFNVVPQVKLKNSLVLANDQGEVFNWDLEEDLSFVGTLPEPSLVFNSSNNLTVYPLAVSSKAYRTDRSLSADIENPGLFAKHYNAETEEEKLKYKSISYFSTGGLLKENTLLTFCNRDTLKLGEESLDKQGQFVALMSLSLDEKDEKRESILLSNKGDLWRFECADKKSYDVNLEKLDQKMLGNVGSIVDSFGVGGEQYALLDDGRLAEVNLGKTTLQMRELNFPNAENVWISATPMNLPEVF